MKHDLGITILLVVLFLVAQFVGLGILSQDIQIVTTPSGQINVTHSDTVIGSRPDVAGADTFIMVIAAVLIGTGLILLIIKLGILRLWKLLFFFAAFMTISVALGVFIMPLAAFAIGFVLAAVKVLKQNIITHNLTEILMYAGIALIFVPLFRIEWIILLLLVISVYDFIAVFKSKHMVTMAEALTESSVFAGFSIPYVRKKNKKTAGKEPKEKTKDYEEAEVTDAILGGGDIAFPLMFAGVVLEMLIAGGMGLAEAFLRTAVVPVAVSLLLLLLLWKAKEGKYYPAMPFLTAGCLIGLGIVFLI